MSGGFRGWPNQSQARSPLPTKDNGKLGVLDVRSEGLSG